MLTFSVTSLASIATEICNLRTKSLKGPILLEETECISCLSAGSLVGVGDVISQQLIERRGLAHHNMQRTAKMMSIGFFFVVSCVVMVTAH